MLHNAAVMKKLIGLFLLTLIGANLMAGCSGDSASAGGSDTVPPAQPGEQPKIDEKSGNAMAAPEKASTD